MNTLSRGVLDNATYQISNDFLKVCFHIVAIATRIFIRILFFLNKIKKEPYAMFGCDWVNDIERGDVLKRN